MTSSTSPSEDINLWFSTHRSILDHFQFFPYTPSRTETIRDIAAGAIEAHPDKEAIHEHIRHLLPLDPRKDTDPEFGRHYAEAIDSNPRVLILALAINLICQKKYPNPLALLSPEDVILSDTSPFDAYLISLFEKLNLITFSKAEKSDYAYDDSTVFDHLSTLPKSETLKPLLAQIYQFSTQNRIEITTETPSLPHYLKLSTDLLSLIAAAYQGKYDIRMEVCLLEDLNTKILPLLEAAKATPQLIGLIIAKHSVGHVTPVLLNLSTDHHQLLDLDVTGRTMHPNDDLKELARAHSLTHFSSTTVRQATPLGCRTEALVILRNALLHLKQKTATSTVPINFSDFPSLSKMPPAEWTYIDQIYRHPPTEALVVRQFFSKQESKEPISLEEFRKHYQIAILFQTTLTLSKDGRRFLPPPVEEEKELQTAPTVPILLDRGETTDTAKIYLTKERSINVYLAVKAYKFAIRYTGFPLEGVPSILRPFIK